jgi:D-glycero-alpha-D-manno-heptose-7-phosphate kinase
MHESNQVIVTRAPTRIDFGGGWTDVPPYCGREGGFVCNLAIAKYATATLGVRAHGTPPIQDTRADRRLIDAAIRRFGPAGSRVTVESDFPVGAGLGGSSAASAAILGALAAARNEPWDRSRIAEDGRVIEVSDLGVAGGRQDHYAAVYGGALGLTFTTSVGVRRIALAETTVAALERRLLLIYTGESRISGETITAVLDAYERRDPLVLRSLRRMKELAEHMAAAIERGDIDALGALVAEHWTHQRALHPAIPTRLIDTIIAQATAHGALGAKALGASGGGTVLVIARDDNADQVRRAMEPLGSPLAFRVDEGGLARLR